MISSSFNWTHGQADLLRRAAKCAPPLGGIRQNHVLRTWFVYSYRHSSLVVLA
jgi:hypothetical protein